MNSIKDYTTENQKRLVELTGFSDNALTIPLSWSENFVNTVKSSKKGAPDIIKIDFATRELLAFLHQIYKPVKLYVPNTNKFIGYGKQFEADMYQLDYKEVADKIHVPINDLKEALRKLQKIYKVVHVEYRDIIVNNVIFNNRIFVEIIPEMFVLYSFYTGEVLKQKMHEFALTQHKALSINKLGEDTVEKHKEDNKANEKTFNVNKNFDKTLSINKLCEDASNKNEVTPENFKNENFHKALSINKLCEDNQNNKGGGRQIVHQGGRQIGNDTIFTELTEKEFNNSFPINYQQKFTGIKTENEKKSNSFLTKKDSVFEAKQLITVSKFLINYFDSKEKVQIFKRKQEDKYFDFQLLIYGFIDLNLSTKKGTNHFETFTKWQEFLDIYCQKELTLKHETKQTLKLLVPKSNKILKEDRKKLSRIQNWFDYNEDDFYADLQNENNLLYEVLKEDRTKKLLASLDEYDL